MFAGNAIVASDTSGIPEAIEHGVNGLLTPPGKAEPLRDALRQVLADPTCRQELGSAALDLARKRFTIDAMTTAYERHYRSRLRQDTVAGASHVCH
jgi:glycosyltransferase involved in cell wall biosynthesis